MKNKYVEDKDLMIGIENEEPEKEDLYTYHEERISVRKKLCKKIRYFGKPRLSHHKFWEQENSINPEKSVYNQNILLVITYRAGMWNLTLPLLKKRIIEKSQ